MTKSPKAQKRLSLINREKKVTQMTPIFESDVEEFVIELLQKDGFDY